MLKYPKKALRIYKKNGLMSLIGKTKVKFQREVLPTVSNIYWDLRGGTQEVKINGESAIFEASRASGGDKVRWMSREESHFLGEVVSEIKKDDTFYDIGANIGFFSCFAANIIERGKVVAFEPYPPNVRQLERNLSHNSPKSGYEVAEVALSDHHGTIDFTASSDGPGKQTGTIHPTGDSIKVETWPGDQYIMNRDLSPPSVVKIDVEGAEPLVLRGLKESLAQDDCRALFCEIHLPAPHRPSFEDYGETKEGLIDIIEDMGFEIEFEMERRADYYVKATK